MTDTNIKILENLKYIIKLGSQYYWRYLKNPKNGRKWNNIWLDFPKLFQCFKSKMLTYSLK